MMAPSVALGDDGVALAIGSAGGTRLRTALVGVAAGILDEGLDPVAAVMRPRFHRVGDVVNAEPGVDEDALFELEREVGRAPLACTAPLLRRRQPDLAGRRRGDPRRAAPPRPSGERSFAIRRLEIHAPKSPSAAR